MRITKRSPKVYHCTDPHALDRTLYEMGYRTNNDGQYEIGLSTLKIHRNGTCYCDSINGNWYYDASRLLEELRHAH